MSSRTSHELFGVALWIVLLIILLFSYSADLKRMIYISVLAFVFLFIGANIPDIDNKNSRAFKNTRFFLAIITFLLSFVFMQDKMDTSQMQGAGFLVLICGLMALAVVILLHAIMPEHRGPIHSIKTGLVYAVISFVITYLLLFDFAVSGLIGLFSFLSFFSHLLLDKSVKF